MLLLLKANVVPEAEVRVSDDLIVSEEEEEEKKDAGNDDEDEDYVVGGSKGQKAKAKNGV